MKTEYRKLGDLVDLIDERNKSLVSTGVLGISIDKEFMPSVANTIGTDLSNYKLLKKNRFACNPMHVGRDERLPVSLYNKEIPAIVSPAYFMFEIADTKSVLPEYLMLNFKRADFDRNCWFRTDGSVRGGITWEALCEIELPIPAIEKQQKIVDAYNVITKRIQIKQKINEKLEKTAQTIYRKMFIEDAELKVGNIKDFCHVFTGFPFDSELYSANEGVTVLRGENVTEEHLRWDTLKKYNSEITERISKHYLKEWDIVIGMDGSKVGKNWSLIHDFDLPLLLAQRVACIRTNSISKQIFLYLSLKISKFTEYVTQVNTGTTILHISNSQIEDFPILLPSDEMIENFGNKVESLLKQRKENLKELNKLFDLQQLIISCISGM